MSPSDVFRRSFPLSEAFRSPAPAPWQWRRQPRMATQRRQKSGGALRIAWSGALRAPGRQGDTHPSHLHFLNPLGPIIECLVPQFFSADGDIKLGEAVWAVIQPPRHGVKDCHSGHVWHQERDFRGKEAASCRQQQQLGLSLGLRRMWSQRLPAANTSAPGRSPEWPATSAPSGLSRRLRMARISATQSATCCSKMVSQENVGPLKVRSGATMAKWFASAKSRICCPTCRDRTLAV